MSDSRTIVLTGATRGLGRAMTDRFIEQGHTLAGCGRSLGGIKSLESTFGSTHRFDCVDVADDDQVAAWAASVLETHGAPDLLLNNAALINPNAPLWEVPVDQFDAVVDVNIKGVANVLRHFVPAMIERKDAVVKQLTGGVSGLFKSNGVDPTF